MKQRTPILLLAIGVLVILVWVVYLRRHQTSDGSPIVPANLPHAPTVETRSSGAHDATNAIVAPDTNLVYRLKVGQVLATVNGVSLRLGDLIPLSLTNVDAVQQLSPEVYNYFLDRAVVRELTFQAAKAAGVMLNESEELQLAKMRGQRESSEPGLVEKKTVDAAQVEFELRDAQAFMLQTELMAQGGFTPNVTPEQVQAYYHDHASEFPALPEDPQARADAWRLIDIATREKLAKDQRADYNKRLTEYNASLKAKAQISVEPLTLSAPTPPKPL